MKINQNTAISTPKVLLVPYERRHVPRYHEWMSDPAILEATASEPLTLDEEFENQASWRTASDKLTFILCHPVNHTGNDSSSRMEILAAGQVDSADKMVGDVNLFLSPWIDDDDDDNDDCLKDMSREPPPVNYCQGEIDIMVAGTSDRGKGLGKAAVSTFLHYICSHLDAILNEYQQSPSSLKWFKVMIQESNRHSIALFKSLGFEQQGDTNYFGETMMVLKDLTRLSKAPDGYAELEYKMPSTE